MTRPSEHVSFTVPIGHLGSSNSVEWRWPNPDSPEWLMAEKDGVAWISTGPLTEEGRQAILEHFDLVEAAADLPLEVLSGRSPKELELMYFGRAIQIVQAPREHVSDRIGDHVFALEAA